MNEQNSLISHIGLSKLFLWMDAERLESYPEAFARLKAGTLYTKKSLASEALGLITSGSGKFVRGDFLSNLYGLERTNEQKVSIRGINALKETSDGLSYVLSHQAIEIGQAYIRKDETGWLHEFAKMVASYEIRTRLLLYLIGKGGYVLSFPGGEFFGSRSSRALLSGMGNQIAVFADNYQNFNQLLQEYRWIALGPWWEEEIQRRGLQIDQDFRFEGIRESTPPTNWLNTRLKISLFLMKYLGIIESHSGEWIVNPIRATEIFGEEIAQDFVKIEFDRSPIQRLHQWHDDLQDELGFVIVADLVQHWADYKSIPLPLAETEFDAWMRQQTYHGRVTILETHAGQPRLGRGLYGDETARKIRFEITEA